MSETNIGGDANSTGHDSVSTLATPNVQSAGVAIEEQSIHHLLSISKNPMVKDMTTEKLNAYITRIRTVATSPQTMSSVLTSESRKKRPMSEAQRKRKELIDSI